MEPQSLTWTVFFEEAGGRAALLRAEIDRHWESADAQPTLGGDGVRVWADKDGVPVVVEAVVSGAPEDEHHAESLERQLWCVLGRIQLGSPTLWGRFAGWVWYGVQSSDPAAHATCEECR